MPFDRLAALENRHKILNSPPLSDTMDYSLDTPGDIPGLLESGYAIKGVSPQLRGTIKRLE